MNDKQNYGESECIKLLIDFFGHRHSICLNLKISTKLMKQLALLSLIKR